MLAVEQNDTLALQLRSRFAQNVAIAVSGTVQLFSGNLVIVGGAAAQFGGEEALEVSRRALQRLTILHSQFGLTKIVASTLLPDPATLGAASLVIQAVMDGKIAVLPTH
jgi:predicted NBD/HSP70 family sugar kinase